MTEKQNQHEFRYDSYPVKCVRLDHEGIMRGSARVTKTGVFPYKNPDGSIRFELRHPDEVFSKESMDSLKLRPVTNDHPPMQGNPPARLVTPHNIKELSIGTTGENPTREDEYLSTSIVINDEEGIRAVQSGIQQISCGYRCKTHEEEGFFEGQKYTHRQSGIRYNHVSIVKSGRVGSDVRLNLDSMYIDDETETETGEKLMTTDKMETIRIDGINYKADPEVHNKINSYEKEVKELSEKIDAMDLKHKEISSELEKTKAQRDGFEEKLAESEKLDHSEEVRAKVKELSSVISVANKIMPGDEKMDSMDCSEIIRAVVAKKFPSLSIEDKSDDYIKARFDSIAEELQESEGEEISEQRKALIARTDSKEKQMNARDKYILELNKPFHEKGKK